MIFHDIHMHSSFSTDSDEPMENMILSAINKGLKGICFTEHMDYGFPSIYVSEHERKKSGDLPVFTFDTKKYFDKINELKEKYSDKIEILTGIEIGLSKDYIDENAILSQKEEFDYVIGSTHLVDNIDIYSNIYWEQYGEEKGLEKYFESYYNNLCDAKGICIDTAGHMDYAIRYSPTGYGFYTYEKYKEISDAILEYIVKNGIALEINTSGYKRDNYMPNPHIDAIKRYIMIGGKDITFGSDAHAKENIAYKFDDVCNLIKNTGIKKYVIYRKHTKTGYSF